MYTYYISPVQQLKVLQILRKKDNSEVKTSFLGEKYSMQRDYLRS